MTAETDLELSVDAVDRISLRPLAPTPRQREAGTPQPPVAGPPVAEDVVQGGRGARLATSLRERFDLRQVKGPKTPIVVFLILTFFGSMTDLVGSVIAPELRISYAAAPALLGLVAIIIPIVQYTVQPFYGWLVDRVNRVYLERVTRLGGSALISTAAFAGSLSGYVGLTGSGGLLLQGAAAPTSTLLADYYEEEDLGRFFTLLPAVQAMATVVGPLTIGILISATNWRIALLTVGATTAVMGLTTFLLREPERGAIERRQLGATDVEPPPPMSFGESWRVARSITTLRRLWFATPFWVATTTLPTLYVLGFYFSEVYGLTATQRGLVTTVMGLSALAGLLWIGPLAGRLLANAPGRLLVLASGFMVLQALSMSVLAFSSFLPLSVLATIPLALGIAMVPPLVSMVTVKVVPPAMRGLGVSTLAPWTLAGLLLFGLALVLAGTGGARATTFILLPLHLIGAFFLAGAAGGVARDVKAAKASVLAVRAVSEAKAAGAAKLLVCRGVEVSYQGTQVLFGVDLDVEDGEMLALLGTNGAGKSTLLRAVAGIHEASNGAILFEGRDVMHEPAHANASRGIVMMPGGKATFPTLTVEENLRTATWLCRGDSAEAQARIEQVLEFFPVLRERMGDVAGNLSGGEQQMVGLGQAFLMRPRLLMIDELSLGLAPSVVEHLLDILRRIHQQGATVILVEQSLNVALTIAGRAVFMEKGAVRFDGPTEELLRRPELIRSVFIGGASAGSSRSARSGRLPAREPSSADAAALAVEDVHVRFGGLHALRGAGLTVAPGEIVGIIGPNGAGKTTLFDVISGFTRPAGGRVLLSGEDVTSQAPDARARRGLARSFQSAKLFPALTVRENIAVALQRKAVRNELMTALWLPHVRESETKLFARVDDLIELLGLDAYATKFVHELSTGSRRAVDVACVMAADPEVLLLDEPSSGLAQAETEALGPVLTRLAADTGCALLVIEHDMPLISSMSDRLVAMELGSVIVTGLPQEVLNHPRVLASYLSASEGVTQRSGSAGDAITAALTDRTGRHGGTTP